MISAIVLFLSVMCDTLIVGKSIISANPQNTDPTMSPLNVDDLPTQIYPKAINSEAEDSQYISNPDSVIQINLYKIGSTEPIESFGNEILSEKFGHSISDIPEARESDPSYALRQSNPIIDTTGSKTRLDESDKLGQNDPTSAFMTRKQATEQGEDKYLTSTMRTTSEDTLRYLLSQKLPFPHPAPDQVGESSKGVMFPVTLPLWTFEGYDDGKSVNERVVDDNSNCEGQRIRCITDTEYNQPVCVKDLSMPDDGSVLDAAREKGFSSSCEVEYRNCLKRFELTGKYYADSFTEDYLEFEHYGWCHKCDIAVECPTDKPRHKTSWWWFWTVEN